MREKVSDTADVWVDLPMLLVLLSALVCRGVVLVAEAEGVLDDVSDGRVEELGAEEVPDEVGADDEPELVGDVDDALEENALELKLGVDSVEDANELLAREDEEAWELLLTREDVVVLALELLLDDLLDDRRLLEVLDDELVVLLLLDVVFLWVVVLVKIWVEKVVGRPVVLNVGGAVTAGAEEPPTCLLRRSSRRRASAWPYCSARSRWCLAA